MDTLLQDLRYALRQMRLHRGFAAVALLTLALGIGANTAIFSMVNAVLFAPLPYDEADRLVTVFPLYPSLGLEASTAVPTYYELREGGGPFESVAVQTWWGVNFSGSGPPERLLASKVSGAFFTTYGVPAALGRTLLPEDVASGRQHVVVLGHGLWQRLFGASPDVLGRTLWLDGEAYQVVGVMPPRFTDFFHPEAQLWAPAIFPPEAAEQRTSEFLVLTARLRPGISVEQAQAHVAGVATDLKRRFPDSYPSDWTLRLRPIQEQATGNVRPALLVLLGAVGFVLLIAVANVTNLLLARATRRRKEIAVRTATGAARGRLVRQLLTEALLLALSGGVLGVLLGHAGARALVALAPPHLPPVEASLDARVLAFAFGVSLLAGLLVGLLPALQGSETAPQSVLREEGRGAAAAFGRRGVRRLVVIAEVALALVLMVGAGLLIRSFARLQRVDAGFAADGVVTLMTALPASRYDQPEEAASFFRAVLSELRALPGVRAVGAVSTLPATGSGWTQSFQVEAYEPAVGGSRPWGEFRLATPGYFEALRIPLLRGRTFTLADDAAALPVAVVDRVLAERYWPGEDPIGKRVGLSSGGETEWREVVGVVGHVASAAVESDSKTQLYLPHAQMPVPFMTLVVRAAGDPASLVGSIRDAVLRVDPDQPVFNVQPMQAHVATSRAQRRFVLLVLGSFAALALALAAIGIYGVMSYSVAQRRREIGIRVALGAESRRAFGLVLRQAMATTLVGLAVGIAGAFALVRLLRSQLYAVEPTDPLTFGLAIALFAGVAMLATWVPARRAARVEPAVALRDE